MVCCGSGSEKIYGSWYAHWNQFRNSNPLIGKPICSYLRTNKKTDKLIVVKMKFSFYFISWTKVFFNEKNIFFEISFLFLWFIIFKTRPDPRFYRDPDDYLYPTESGSATLQQICSSPVEVSLWAAIGWIIYISCRLSYSIKIKL